MITRYSIHELELLTGIKAPTIRIWEKRYNLISPSRTASNRRFYSREQLMKLMNICSLVNIGHKISHLAVLSKVDLAQQIEQTYKNVGACLEYIGHVDNLTIAMLAFDEAAFTKVFDTVVAELGFGNAMANVFYPFLKKAGLLWRVEKAATSQEHFASAIIRRKLIVAINKLPTAVAGTKKFLLFLPVGERHENGLLFADYLIRASGHASIYLGQNVPYTEVKAVADMYKPDAILTFFIAPKPIEEIDKEILHLSQSHPNAQLLVSGNANLLRKVNAEANFTYLKSVEGLLECL